MTVRSLGLLIPLLACAQTRPWTELYPEEAAAMNKACGASEWAACRDHLLKLKDVLDGRADIVYRLAKVEASLGNRDAGMQWLSLYSKTGLLLGDPAKDAVFAPWKSDAEFAAIVDRLKSVAAPVTHSELFATLPEAEFIPEDIVFDARSNRFYISSVKRRKILSLSRDGHFADFASGLEWPVLALAVDSKQRRLWATITAVDEGKTALLKFDLDSGKLLKRYDPPEGKHEMGDMTLSPAGDAYVSDGLGSVFMVDPERDRLELLFGPGTFRSPQTPAFTPDGRLLVPDYSRGISIVDLKTRTAELLRHPPDLSLGGIDGLYLHGSTLIAIQNGTAPERLIRMELDRDLRTILSWQTIEANWKGLGDPTHGVLVEGRFYYIANSGWDVKPGGKYEPATIRVMDWR